jgi:hypothetical protein
MIRFTIANAHAVITYLVIVAAGQLMAIIYLIRELRAARAIRRPLKMIGERIGVILRDEDFEPAPPAAPLGAPARFPRLERGRGLRRP